MSCKNCGHPHIRHTALSGCLGDQNNMDDSFCDCDGFEENESEEDDSDEYDDEEEEE